jgi:hypothetical protein
LGDGGNLSTQEMVGPQPVILTYINAFTAYALIRAPKALMPPFPIKNVQKAHADCDDARHQKCGGQDNMLNHGNASFVADTSPLSR